MRVCFRDSHSSDMSEEESEESEEGTSEEEGPEEERRSDSTALTGSIRVMLVCLLLFSPALQSCSAEQSCRAANMTKEL